jgi:hypothetical protein
MNNKVQSVLNDAWLNIDIDEKEIFNPVHFIAQDDPEEFHIRLAWLMMKPKYFSFVCKEIFNIDLLPVQSLILQEIWNRKFPMLIGSRGLGKSFILSLYAMLRAFFLPRRKIIIVGAAFRQSKVLFEYMNTIWENAPILRDMVSSNSGPRRDVDMCRMTINDSTITCLPLGDGTKIRGQRANDIVTDEFASVPREIFENVVAGFAAVTATPIENVKMVAAQKKAEELGEEFERGELQEITANQIILSGTAYYDFNHFAEYWKRWKSIISSKGEPKKTAEIFGTEDVPDGFDWKQYSIIRIPFELLPEGFLDAAQVARSRATVHSGIYQMEFGACFTTDSQGFFKRTLIESCVVSNENRIKFPSGEADFRPALKGSPNLRYVFGVDPASEIDNFSITVVELHPEHRRIVNCWTTTRSEHKEKVKMGLVSETDFYSYCARKIRDLMGVFPCARIAMDAQGGGIAVMEALHDKDKIRQGELPIWPTIEEDKEKDTDGNAGLHILDMCQFANSEWLGQSNHGMRKDFEDKVLIFPFFDSISLGLASIDDNVVKRKMDTLEDCIMEIEELKNELSMIIITQTPSGRDKWDTPEIKIPGGRKDRLRKDRYSSLLMANMSARTIQRTPAPVTYDTLGGFAERTESEKEAGPDYIGPAWFTEGIGDVY